MSDAGPKAPRRRRVGPRNGKRSALIVGSFLPALPAVRSLSKAGLRVIVGIGPEFSTAHRSRYCDEVLSLPPVTEVDGYVATLAAFIEGRPDLEVILPLRPDHVALLARHRGRLPPRPAIAMPDPDVVLTCLDKERMSAIAMELGVPYRGDAVVHDLAALAAGAEAVGFPCIVKPIGDHAGLLPGRRKAVRIADAAALSGAFPVWPRGHDTLIVQPYVDGPRHNVSFAARDGTILMAFHSDNVRTDRLDGTGLGVAWVSTAPDPRFRLACDALVERLRYTGVGLAQFLVPARGEPHFLEINPRVGMVAKLATACGLDLNLAACQLAGGEVGWRPDPGYTSPAGVRCAWTARELYGLLAGAASRSIRSADLLPWVERMFRTAVEADVHLTWSRDDPMPAVAAYAQLLAPSTWLAMRRPP